MSSSTLRHNQCYNEYWGDSLNINPNYPLKGPLTVVGELFDHVNNKEWVVSHFTEKLDDPSQRPNFILFYNPYSPTEKDSFGLFDYFESLEEAQKWIQDNRQGRIEDYFYGRSVFFSYHIYHIQWPDEEPGLPLDGSVNNIKLQVLTMIDCPPHLLSKSTIDRVQMYNRRRKRREQFQREQELREQIQHTAITASNESVDVNLLDLDQLKRLHQGLDTVQTTITTLTVTPETDLESTKDDPLYDKFAQYSGHKVTVHNLSGPLLYFDLYQNFLSQWDDQETVQKNILKIKEYLTGEASLTNFLRNVQKAFEYFQTLIITGCATYREQLKSLPETRQNQEYLNSLKYQLETWDLEKFKSLITPISKFRHGDLIDLEGYLGTGLFMVYLHPSTRELLILPTLGDRGHILPEPGFSLVKEHGLAYFLNSEISGFQISHFRKVQLRDPESGDYITQSLTQPMYLEAQADVEQDGEMDEVIVDGVYLYGYLTPYYV